MVTVSGVPNVTVTGTSNQEVIWSLTSGIGAIDPNSGVYTAPATTGTATVTATSVADPTESASATLTIVTAADPTLSSLSPPTGAIGATLQQVYLTGTNFICTTSVLVNGSPLPSGSFFAVSSTTLLVNVPDSVLSTLPTSGSTVTLTVTVERQGGTQPLTIKLRRAAAVRRRSHIRQSLDAMLAEQAHECFQLVVGVADGVEQWFMGHASCAIIGAG